MTAVRGDVRRARDRISTGRSLRARHRAGKLPGGSAQALLGELLDIFDRTGTVPRKPFGDPATQVTEAGGVDAVTSSLCLTADEMTAFGLMPAAQTGQVRAAPGERQEVRDVLPPPGCGLGPQPERLRHHAGHAAGEVQREQEPLLFQALEPVMTARGHQELETGPVQLAGPPREVPPRLAPPPVACHRPSQPAPHDSSRRAASGTS